VGDAVTPEPTDEIRRNVVNTSLLLRASNSFVRSWLIQGGKGLFRVRSPMPTRSKWRGTGGGREEKMGEKQGIGYGIQLEAPSRLRLTPIIRSPAIKR
jgi:hypothetical protein